MNNETRLILESLRMLLWENKRKYDLMRIEKGDGLESVESSEIVEMVKEINETLNPPTNNLAEQRAEEIKIEGVAGEDYCPTCESILIHNVGNHYSCNSCEGMWEIKEEATQNEVKR